MGAGGRKKRKQSIFIISIEQEFLNYITMSAKFWWVEMLPGARVNSITYCCEGKSNSEDCFSNSE